MPNLPALQKEIQSGAVPAHSAEILQDLAKIGAGSPSQVAMVNSPPRDGVTRSLTALYRQGWVDRIPIINGAEKFVYYPSARYIAELQGAAKKTAPEGMDRR